MKYRGQVQTGVDEDGWLFQGLTNKELGGVATKEIPFVDGLFSQFAVGRFKSWDYENASGCVKEETKQPIADSVDLLRRLRVAYTGLREGLDPDLRSRMFSGEVAELKQGQDLRDLYDQAYCYGFNNRPE